MQNESFRPKRREWFKLLRRKYLIRHEDTEAFVNAVWTERKDVELTRNAYRKVGLRHISPNSC